MASLLTTYLEMNSRPERPVRALAPEHLALHCQQPSVAYYRFLYGQVGGPWSWVDRARLADEQLADILAEPGLELYVLHVNGHPAGYSELSRRQGEVKLAYFGLFPSFIGRGLGRLWLDWTVDQAWRGECSRLWVHTCSLDHPNALPTYQKAGFAIYRCEETSIA